MSRSHWAGTRLIRCALVASVGVLVWIAPVRAQEEAVPRPIPTAVKPPQGFAQALDRGWRSTTGAPGAGYWQQEADYDIEAKLDPDSARLEGTVRITYVNHAPVTLPSVWLYLHQNFHKEGVARHIASEITGGMELTRVSAQGQDLEDKALSDGPAYQVVNGGLLQIRTPAPVSQGDTLRLEIQYAFMVPRRGIGARMGHSNDRDMYMIAYWFPKMAVLDDLLNGAWDAQPFLGTGEFYDEYGDYSVAITVPEDWTVMATGELQNPDSVYSAITEDLLARAAVSDTVVTIAGQAERDAKTVTTHPADGLLTYRYAAENVRDFVWTASKDQRWDAASAVVPDRDDDGDDDRVLIQTFWDEDTAPLWSDAWLYGKQSIEFHSRFTGFAYPWSHMTLVESSDIIPGGMEFPMMTLIQGSARDGQALFNTVSHELAHMWVPMVVGTNERRYAWMDEGSADFLSNESRTEFWPGVDHQRVEARQYLEAAAQGQEQSMMRQADWYAPGNGYSIASYQKPAALLAALREVIGSVLFDQAYKTFISEWAYKHPTPWDFFNTFERFAGKDLDWFWSAFYYETWSVDHAVRNVTAAAGGGQTVVIEDRGTAPFPTEVRIRTSAGNSLLEEIPVEHWLAGKTTYEISVPADQGRVTRVDLDPDGHVPDVDRQNDFWPRG